MATDAVSTDYSQYTSVPLKANSPAKSKIDGALSQAQFLKLMTTQMTHQDPSQPMTNGEFLTQMAQFGTVSGIQDLQKSFSNFAAKVSGDQALQAAGLVGRSVLTSTTRGLLETGKEIAGNINLTGSTSNLSVKVSDAKTGAVVRNLALGQQKQGSVPFSWDGQKEDGALADPGIYKIEASAAIDGKNTVLETVIKSKVESVNMGGSSGGLTVNLAGGAGSVNFNQIQEIL